MSNDHDGVSEDGQEPVDAVPSDDAARASAPEDGATTAASEVAASPAEASDDLPSDDAADKTVGADTAAVSTAPVSAGSARAAARRSAARAGISESKGTATPKRAAATQVKKPNVFARLGRFLREVVAELRKVIWPGRRELITYTTVVILFVAVMVALVAGLDLLFAKGVIAVFG